MILGLDLASYGNDLLNLKSNLASEQATENKVPNKVLF